MSYSVDLYNPAGLKHGAGALRNITAIEFARSFSNVGEATVTISDLGVDPTLFRKNWRIAIYRYVDGYAPYLVGNTVWFIRSVEWNVLDGTIVLHASDMLVLLDDRIVAYTPQTHYADKTEEELGSTPHADDSILAYLRENFGADAVDTTRNSSAYLTIPANPSLGALFNKQAAWQSILSTIQDVCKGSTQGGIPIYFDIFSDQNSKAVFQLWIGRRGADRSATSRRPQVFSQDRNNLAKLSIIWDYSKEKNVAYVGGYDTGASRVIEVVIDPTRLSLDPFARSEMFVDGGDNDVPEVLQDIGKVALDGARATISADGEAVETPESIFGIHYDYGDTVSVVAKGIEIPCDISAFSGSYGSGKDTITVRLTGQRQI